MSCRRYTWGVLHGSLYQIRGVAMVFLFDVSSQKPSKNEPVLIINVQGDSWCHILGGAVVGITTGVIG